MFTDRHIEDQIERCLRHMDSLNPGTLEYKEAAAALADLTLAYKRVLED